MSFAESFDEITTLRKNGLDLYDIANQTINLKELRENNPSEYYNQLREFGFENINIGYEEVVTTVLDAIRRFFEKLWVAIKSFFNKVVAQQKLYISTMNRKYSAIEKLFKVKSTINITDAKVETCFKFSDIDKYLRSYKDVCKTVFDKVSGFRLYGFLDNKTITGISIDEFNSGIDIAKTLNLDSTKLFDIGFVLFSKPVKNNDFKTAKEFMEFRSGHLEINYNSEEALTILEHNKSIHELGYTPETIKNMIRVCTTYADIIISKHTLITNDLQKVYQSVTTLSNNKVRHVGKDESGNDNTVAEKCTKAVGIYNTFNSMIQSVVFAAGFYNTTVQTTIDKIYDAIKAHVEANLANRP